MEKENRVKVSIYMIPEFKDYINDTARSYGLTTSAFMTMIIHQFKNQEETLKNFKKISDLDK